jgi:hypothetical protein
MCARFLRYQRCRADQPVCPLLIVVNGPGEVLRRLVVVRRRWRASVRILWPRLGTAPQRWQGCARGSSPRCPALWSTPGCRADGLAVVGSAGQVMLARPGLSRVGAGMWPCGGRACPGHTRSGRERQRHLSNTSLGWPLRVVNRGGTRPPPGIGRGREHAGGHASCRLKVPRRTDGSVPRR